MAGTRVAAMEDERVDVKVSNVVAEKDLKMDGDAAAHLEASMENTVGTL